MRGIAQCAPFCNLRHLFSMSASNCAPAAPDARAQFLDQLDAALRTHSLVKLVLARHVGADPTLQRIIAKPLQVKGQEQLSLVYRHQTRDITRNLPIDQAQALIAQLAHSEKLDGIALPEPDAPSARHLLDNHQPRIELKNGTVSYNDRPILDRLSWTVNPGEHWQITGPNGAGKSTLLSLITGDHPQGYSNDLTLFGRRRGSGETIWDIKKHIGYVSSSLHLDYRVSTTVRNVILSGYFDSIGIYQAVSDKQHKLAQQWLDILGVDNRVADAPFHSLSWGQQRLALIVRALVKHPTLLILDEPLQGLDPLNRQLIRRFVDVLISEGETQLLFVSHHAEDAPSCITHRLEFVPDGEHYYYRQSKID